MRETIGGLARDYVAERHGLAETAAVLAGFLGEVAARREELLGVLDRDAEDGTLESYFREEIRWAARDLGLSGAGFGKQDLFGDIGGGR